MCWDLPYHPHMPAQDDRGNPINTLRPRDIRRAADAEDPTRAILARHLRDAIRAESQRFSVQRFVWIIGAVLAWVFFQFVAAQTAFRDIPGIRLGAIFGPALFLTILGRELTRRRVSRLVAATAVAEGICGQCCYSLGGVPADADLRITCPECGAAWAQDRITRPHWAGDALPTTFHDNRLPWKEDLLQWIKLFITGTPKPSTLIAADDRGRFVRTVDSRFLLVPHQRRQELTRQRIAALRRASRRKGRILRFILCLPLAIAGISAAVGAVALIQDRETTGAIVVTCVSLFFLLVAIVMNLGHSFLPPAHTARVLVSDGLCGSCIAGLAGQAVDAQGLTACPGCGASWRTSPQTQP